MEASADHRAAVGARQRGDTRPGHAVAAIGTADAVDQGDGPQSAAAVAAVGDLP